MEGKNYALETMMRLGTKPKNQEGKKQGNRLKNRESLQDEKSGKR